MTKETNISEELQKKVNNALELHSQANNAMLDAIEQYVDENGVLTYEHEDGIPSIHWSVKKNEYDDYMVYDELDKELFALEDNTSDEFYKMLLYI